MSESQLSIFSKENNINFNDRSPPSNKKYVDKSLTRNQRRESLRIS